MGCLVSLKVRDWCARTLVIGVLANVGWVGCSSTSSKIGPDDAGAGGTGGSGGGGRAGAGSGNVGRSGSGGFEGGISGAGGDSSGRDGGAGTSGMSPGGSDSGGMVSHGGGGAAPTGGTPSSGTAGQPSGEGGADPMVPSEPGAALGSACESDAECESGFCTDGVCCDSRCNDVCARCDAAETRGSCTATDQDTACPSLVCPQNSDCRRYAATDAARNCEDIGLCRSELSCTPSDVMAGTACAANTGRCDGSGECVVDSKSALGETCAANGDCGSGFCAETAAGTRVCCESACNGNCQACAQNGRCTASLADDARCGSIACPADSTCRDYPTSITADRCISGRCGSAAELCEFTPRGAGTACSSSALCDTAGGCTVPKRALGATCTAAAQCASNFCVDGVCCESACSFNCMACRAGTGLCDVVPADDPICAPVDCNFDTECLTNNVSGNLTTNRCAALGRCKTRSDCGAQFRPARTACDPAPDICDGAGTCATPTVTCGGSECSAAGSVCCYGTSSGSAPSQSCVGSSSCQGTSLTSRPWQTPIGCDEHADCRSGELCCLTTAADSHISCLPADSCNRSLTQSIYREVCRAPGFTGTCARGSCTREWPNLFPGWTFCEL